MTKTNHIHEQLLSGFRLSPNPGQGEALAALAAFLTDPGQHDGFILTGAAGSGKTSVIRSLIHYFYQSGIDFSLAAPTGRAAQLAGKKANAPATTLHSLVFKVTVEDDPPMVFFQPKIPQKLTEPRYYVVDEASMIGGEVRNMGIFSQNRSLLEQLLLYVRGGHPASKIIFVGDTYQLPPVGADLSPALSAGFLRENFGFNALTCHLEQVERCKQDSYILANAGRILEAIKTSGAAPAIRYQSTGSFSGGIKRYLTDFENDPFNQAVMIAWANGQVNALNEWARNFRYQYRNRNAVIMPDEMMLCNQNTELDSHMLFKGAHFVVKGTWKPEEFAGLHFINTEILFDGLNGDKGSAKTKILLESVSSKDGSLTVEQERNLIHEAIKRNRRFRETRQPKDDAFVNAVRARYGYALTCHKAQGGEWKHVYLHPGYRPESLRWLYTAVTRAVEELYSWQDK